MHQEILPIEEAADRVGISRRQIDRWVEDGEIEAFHREKDRRTFVDLEDVKRRHAGFLSGRKRRNV